MIEVTAPPGQREIVTREVVVTREILVTPPGAGLAVPGPDLELTRPVVTQTITVTVSAPVTVATLGSNERPVQLWFPPHVPAQVLAERGPALQNWLAEETDLAFTIQQAQTVPELVAALCAAPDEAVGFLPALAIVPAYDQCLVQAGGVAVQDDVPFQMGMVVVRTNSGYQSLADLEGLTWAVPESGSLTRDLAVQTMFVTADVEPGEMVAYSGDNDALLALLDGEVDFATATYLPPILPYAERVWEYGVDDPAEWRFLGIAPERHPQGYIVVVADPESGGYRIRDARAGIFDVAPAVFGQTRILTVTAPLPNDLLVFGPEFPLATARGFMNALANYTANEDCAQSLCAPDFYGWQGMQPAQEDTLDVYYSMIRELNLSSDDIWALVAP
jgi:phosphonate transport system substrate-binding protein